MPSDIGWSRYQVVGLATLVVGTSLGVWLLRRSLRTIASAAHQLHTKTVVVVQSAEQWHHAGAELRRRCADTPVLGLDCEWVQIIGRRPVALLQLASLDGYCVLVHLLCMKRPLPDDLRALLRDDSVLKVGVACMGDASQLLSDHGLAVRGCVDLRHLAGRHPQRTQLLARPGLASLADTLLDVQLNKSVRLRCSDWEAVRLSPQQQNYAADDALVGVLLFQTLLAPKVAHLSATSWPRVLSACQGLIDCQYRHSPPAGADLTPNGGTASRPVRRAPTTCQQAKSVDRAYSLRKTRLYDNARLLAPDDQPLSVVESSKARWYVDRGLGDVVQRDPLVVKLRFEPSGRPQLEGSHGKYYLQEKLNCCVRCGDTKGYVRKNIVPQEYRKHFPDIMKSHQSHDVLLMCLPCHQDSNRQDRLLRLQLADECDAPIGTDADVKVREDKSLRQVKSAGRALLRSRHRMPPERSVQLELLLCQYYGVEHVSDHVLQQAVHMNTNRPNDGYVSHGEAVCRHFSSRGLAELERRWRQHFLDTMRPAHLPSLWSVHHHHAKVRWKIRRAGWPRHQKEALWQRCFGTEYSERETEGDLPLLNEEEMMDDEDSS